VPDSEDLAGLHIPAKISDLGGNGGSSVSIEEISPCLSIPAKLFDFREVEGMGEINLALILLSPAIPWCLRNS
jgi:hypothetical protein